MAQLNQGLGPGREVGVPGDLAQHGLFGDAQEADERVGLAHDAHVGQVDVGIPAVPGPVLDVLPGGELVETDDAPPRRGLGLGWPELHVEHDEAGGDAGGEDVVRGEAPRRLQQLGDAGGVPHAPSRPRPVALQELSKLGLELVHLGRLGLPAGARAQRPHGDGAEDAQEVREGRVAAGRLLARQQRDVLDGLLQQRVVHHRLVVRLDKAGPHGRLGDSGAHGFEVGAERVHCESRCAALPLVVLHIGVHCHQAHLGQEGIAVRVGWWGDFLGSSSLQSDSYMKLVKARVPTPLGDLRIAPTNLETPAASTSTHGRLWRTKDDWNQAFAARRQTD